MDEAAEPGAVPLAKPQQLHAGGQAEHDQSTEHEQPGPCPAHCDCHGCGGDLHRDRGAQDDVVAERQCETCCEVRSRALRTLEVGECLGARRLRR